MSYPIHSPDWDAEARATFVAALSRTHCEPRASFAGVTQGEIHLRHWTDAGREVLARVLRRALERNGRRKP